MLDFIKIFLIVLFSVICFASESFAGTLNSLEIKPVNNSFDVVLNSDGNIKTKTVVNSDEMVITLKNTTPADNFYTKYDTHNIDNLVVKQDKNDTKITIKSKNLPTPTPSNNYYWLLSLCGFALLFRRKPQEEKLTFKARTIETSNIDYILEHKIKNKKEEKIKIAA